jgi:hypothetical protein
VRPVSCKAPPSARRSHCKRRRSCPPSRCVRIHSKRRHL